MLSRLRVVVISFAFSPVLAIQAQEASSKLEARRQQYSILASNLVPPLAGARPVPEVDMEPAVIEAKERWRVITLEELETPDRRIKAVAKEAAAAHDAVLHAAQESGDIGLIVDLGLALMMENPMFLARSVSREARKSDGDKYAEAVQRRRAATFLLPELASELAGAVQSSHVLEIDFDENWFGDGKPDRLNLTNATDGTLTTCTLQVDIRGVNGKWVRNVYFVPAWEPGKRLWADYLSSDATQLSSISGTTATEVQDIKVSIWCNELSGEATLHYPGPQRDADRMRQLDKLLAFEVDYVESPFFEQGPCIGVSLAGVTRLPKCAVLVLCHGGNKVDQKLEMSLDGWQKGQRISLQSRGALHSCPGSVDVTVTCDGMEKGCTRSVRVTSSR